MRTVKDRKIKKSNGVVGINSLFCIINSNRIVKQNTSARDKFTPNITLDWCKNIDIKKSGKANILSLSLL